MSLPYIKYYYRRKIKIKHVRKEDEKKDKDSLKAVEWKTLSNEKGAKKKENNTSSSNCLWSRYKKFEIFIQSVF